MRMRHKHQIGCVQITSFPIPRNVPLTVDPTTAPPVAAAGLPTSPGTMDGTSTSDKPRRRRRPIRHRRRPEHLRERRRGADVVRRVARSGRGEAAEIRRRREAVAAAGSHAGHRGILMVRREGPRVGVRRGRVRAAYTPRVLPRPAGETSGVPATAVGQWLVCRQDKSGGGGARAHGWVPSQV